MSGFLNMGSARLNLCSHTHVANTLLIETSPQPHEYYAAGIVTYMLCFCAIGLPEHTHISKNKTVCVCVDRSVSWNMVFYRSSALLMDNSRL